MRYYLILLLVLLFVPPIRAETIHVPGDYPTIQEGIDGAVTGDTVLVHPGTYTENITIAEKGIVVGSLYMTTRNSSYIDSTVIDKSGNGPVVTFTDVGPPYAALVGFSITNSTRLYIGNMIACLRSSPSLVGLEIMGSVYDPMVSGGGIWCMNGSSPSISNVLIADNEAASGGGIYCYLNSDPILANVTIRNNTALFGGGMYCNYSSRPDLFNVVISGNQAAHTGGGIECYDDSSPSLTNVVIVGNSAEYGGGIYAGSDIYFTMVNCTVTGNEAGSGGGARFYSNANPTLENTIFWGNSPNEIYMFDEYFNSTITVRYSDIQGGEDGIVTNPGFTGTINWQEGNIDANPRFIPFPIRGLDHLLRPGSPCIDAGDPSIFDGIYDSHPKWPAGYADGRRSDMGAYGGPGNIEWLRR